MNAKKGSLSRDLPRVLRNVDQGQITTAFAAALADPALAPVVEAIFGCLSPRVVQQMRDEVEARGKVAAKDADAAYGAIVSAIRTMEAAGEITLKQDEEEG